ncbi:hypothetical protein ILYODFUR_016489, partial [Ilyodon furcidens]
AEMKLLLKDHHLKPQSLEGSKKKHADKKRSCSRNWSCRNITLERLVEDNHITVMIARNGLIQSPLNKEQATQASKNKAAPTSVNLGWMSGTYSVCVCVSSRGRSSVSTGSRWRATGNGKSPHMTSQFTGVYPPDKKPLMSYKLRLNSLAVRR